MSQKNWKIWNKKQFTIFIIGAFVIGWVLQAVGSILALQGNMAGFTALLTMAMYAPFLATLIARIPLKGMGFKPKLKGKLRFWLAVWFLPGVFTILGGILYYVIFPSRLDLTGQYLVLQAGEAAMQQLEAQGITIPMCLVIMTVQIFTYAPLINMFAALGEEVGWRGAMQPMLNDRFGKKKGRILAGVIWGAWHWPVMIIAGYEYGLVYFGAPFLGMALFCLITTVMCILLDVAYEKTGCIWVPSLGHGAINAAAALPVMVLNVDYADQMIIGPSPVGIISVLPALVFAVIVLMKDKDER